MIRKIFMLAVALLTTAISFADGPFRNHRYDAFKVLPVNSEQIVFIGNSITNMHEWWEAFGNHNVVNRGVSGAITDEALANIEAIAAGKPKKVFIMLGTNDLGTSGINTTEHVLTNITLIVERFKQTSPNTEIYVQSILPSTSGIRTLDALSAANTALKTMCTEKGATYIDLWNAMQGITNNTLSYDYLHLTSDGYKIWCDIIAPYVMDDENATSVYGTEAQANGGLGGANGMRATVFSKLPVNNDDILIIGDEMINGGEWHELLKSNKIKNRGTTWGYPGPSLADMLKMVDAIFAGGGTPAQVFLYAGVSDVNGSTALETVLTNYKSVVAKIQELSPNTKITLMSLQPTSTAATNTGRVAPFNTLLQQYAAESTTDNIEYLDIYTDFVSNNVANTAYFTGNYLYGKGYVKVAQKIAAAINDASITAITDDEANALYTRFTNRTALGTAIVTAASLPEGDGVGEYTTANLAAVKEKIAAAYAALAASTTSSDVFTTEKTNLSTATTELLPQINMPVTSTNGNENWYQLYTPNRGSRYLSSNGAGEGVVGSEANSYARTMWKFVTRTDGKLDIINRKDGSYLAPTAAYDNQIATSATQPENGWELSYSNAAGLFIIHSGTVQLNQTQAGSGYKVYNWSNGNSGTDRADTGCQYKIALYTGEPDVEPVVPTDENFQNVITDLNNLTEGWYKMRVVTGSDATMQGYITAGNNNILNANTAYRQNASNFYPLKIGAYDAEKPATAWLKVKKIGNKYLIQAISGLGILEPCTATRSLESGNTTLTMSYGGFTTVDKWSYYNPGANTEQPYVGKASSTSHKYAFAPVSASELAAYDIYTVSISGVENAAEIGNDPSVTYTGSAAIGGISKVFNNGYFFFPTGTVPVASDFTVPSGLKMTVDTSSKRLIVAVPTELEPIVTVDALTFATYPYELRKSDAAKLFETTDVTIAMEVTMPASFNGRRAFISAGDPTQAAVSTATKDNSPYFAYGHYGANVAYLASSNGGDRFTTKLASLTANTVSKVVIVVDQTNNNYKVYVDGTLHQEQAFPVVGYVLQTFNKLADNDNAKIYIGGGVTSNNSSFEVFQGKIHTVQFFDRALTTDEMASIEYPASKYFFAANTKQSDGTYIDRYLYVNGSNLANAEGYELDNANYEWSLILNGNDAYYLKNGSGKYLSYAGTSLKVADGEYSFQFKNDAVHTGVGAMSLYNPTSSGGNYMVMAATGASFNQTSSAINNGTWSSDYILTSVAKASIGYPALTVAINDATNLLGRTTEGTNPGYFTTASRTALQEAIDAAIIKNETDGLTDDEVTAAVAALEAAIATYEAARCEVQYSTADNPVWYYILSAATNDYCKDKVMYYDRETERMRFGDKSFSADRIWSFWEQNGKLAIKNYRGEYIGTAGGGTGGGTAFGIADGANYIYTIEDAYDYFIIKDTGTELHAQESGQLIVRWASAEGNASLWRFDEVDVSTPEALVANTSVVQGKVSTGIGNINQPIVRSTIRVSGLTGTCDFQAVKGRFVGTSSADITNVKAYFASNARELFIDADSKMIWREQNGTQYGATVTLANDGTFTITGSKELAPGEYYLWITYDIATDAKEGNTVDTEIISYTVDGKEIVETNGNPAHAVTIFLSEGAVLMPMDKGSLYYRIPAITVSKDGARLVTLTDDRKAHNSDLPSHCYLVAQYSEDNGKTWSEPKTVAGTAETGGNYGHGDASIVTNRDNGEIVGIMTSAGTYGHGFFAGTAAEPPRWKTITSRDGGITWDAPVDHTDDLFGANCSNPNTNTWKSGFSGSGAALQRRNGTLVSSFVNREADNSQNFYFFMSDDGGKNWYVSGTSGTKSADEPKTLERNNGDLAISVRASGYNYYNYTSDEGATWHNPSQTRFTSGISGNACDGEYMVWCSTLEGNPWNIAFQTLPNSSSRQNVSIALSTDEGATFGEAKTICPRGSAYSAAVVLPDGTLGVYYEENGVFGGYTMRFVRFSLDWASNGKYKFTEEVPFYPIKSTVISNPDEETTVNVTLTDANGNTYCDVLENCALGSVKETLAEKYPYITLGTDERLTETTDGGEYDYTNSVTLPFEVSNSTTTAWNNIYFPSNTNTGHPIYLSASSASDTYVPKVTEAVTYGNSQYNTLDNADKISWAIYNVNNSFSFTFKNKLTSKFIKVENVATGNAQNVSYADEADATAFTIVPDAANYNGDYALESVINGTTGYVCSTSASYGYATNYNGNAHQGAWVKIVKAPDYATLIANANAAIASFGDGLGEYKVADANQELLAEAKSAMDNAGSVKLQKLNAYIALTEGATLNMPQTGGFYRISYDYGTAGVKYLQGVASGVKGVAYTADKGAESIFYYADGQLLSYTAGTYLKEEGNTRGLQGVGVAGGTVTFAQSARDAGKYTIAVPSFLHANVNGTEYFADHCSGDGGHAAHDHSIEAVEELPVTIGAAGYSTFYTPVAVAIPDGVTAYRAVINGEYIDLHAFEGTIPAGQAVILQGDANTYNFTITADVEFTGENHLLGTTKKIATNSVDNPYTLQTDSNAATGVVMRRYTGENINGFKMYMNISDAQASALSFRFPGTTAIESVEAEGTGDGRVYDLFGRPVQSPTKGIYVIDGKKVIY